MSNTLQIELVNRSTSATVYAHITGLALDNNNAWFLLSSDGKTPYYPPSPSSIGMAIEADYAIPLGGPGSSTTVTIPHIAGGRIYLSTEKPIVFLLNPGPALVEPSVTNPTDPNYTANWAFCEFTFNHDQLYANISYVDFVSRLPIGLSLINASGETKSVIGIPSNGLDLVCSALEEQGSKDGQGWGSLVVKSDDGSNLRVLSPNQAMVMNPSLLTNYYDAYIDQVWSRFSSSPLHIDTQAGFGSVQGQVSGDELVFDDQRFGRPCTRDIFSASSGPFVTGPDAKRNAIIPRLNAAFNRSTLLKADTFPAATDLYYTEDVTNHYGRVVHGVNVDGRGYTHPYDDATPVGGKDQSGFVNDPAPRTLKIVIGGADGTS
ncbi:hypothetical protein MMC14_005638 [Varicellaria rhodocarpa]|nr:hypothetical protein [Varicellaria rhodocarpa]